MAKKRAFETRVKSLGEKIKLIRESHKASQTRFAFVAGVSVGTVSNWENGKSYPDAKALAKICDKYGISPNYLITDVNNRRDYDRSVKEHMIELFDSLGESEQFKILSIMHVMLSDASAVNLLRAATKNDPSIRLRGVVRTKYNEQRD